MNNPREERKNNVLDIMRKETKMLKADARSNFVKNYLRENFCKNGFYSKLKTLGEANDE